MTFDTGSIIKKRGIMRSTMDRMGILEDTNGDIHFTIRNEEGKIMFRKHRNYRHSWVSEEEQRPKYTYDIGAKAALFPLHLLREFDDTEIWLVEGELDAAVMIQNGFFALSTTGGAGTFRADWGYFFEGRIVHILYDNDNAGIIGAQKVAQVLHKHNVPFFINKHEPRFKDMGEVAESGENVREYVFRSMKNIVAFVPPVEKEAWTKKNPMHQASLLEDSRVARAKAYPIPMLLENRGVRVFHTGKFQCFLDTHSGIDRNPSGQYYEESNTIHFFCCDRHMDAIDVVRYFTKCSFMEAVYKLAP